MIKKIVIGLVFKNKKILLQLRDNKKEIVFPNKWGFFSGEINIGETHHNAIKRELFEELNIKNFKSLKFITSHFEAKHRSIFFIYTLKLNEKFFLQEGSDSDFFNFNEILKGKKSKKLKIYAETAERILMKKIINFCRKFFYV